MYQKVDSLEPLINTLWLYDRLHNVRDKRGKIARMIHSGELLPMRRGLYATRPNLHPFGIAASIYGPSYISFETALAFYGLIPEAVHEIMSATLKRNNLFANHFGRYRYLKVPRPVYALGIERIASGSLPYLIASPTKALCDRIALEPRMRSLSDVQRWLELMRLNEDINIDGELLQRCAAAYGRPSVRLLCRFAEKHGGVLQ